MSLFSLFFGCNKSSNSASINLEQITEVAEKEKGFKDILLKIVSEQKMEDSYVYIAKGLSGSKVVGLKFEIKSYLPNGIDSNGNLDPKNGFIRNAIKISSIGKESDEFLKAISKLYEFSTNKKFTNDTLSPTAFSLNKSIVEVEKLGYYKFKLFFRDNENDKEEDYCELYLNINTNEKTIELLEKDNEYRKSIIRALSDL
ncbi:hypothetical protein [Flavobacterium sp. JAS]|uniref:hypothetical protein n=1 Tax=Flavobacterium sp. JAS TaxID=2897329 RepID=UPI001E2C085D|nr:hypothetical protein [Flavobacterium sp. JAS]MCD0470716.1 hypothetical protein [Flavobacterium sp. JAS]